MKIYDKMMEIYANKRKDNTERDYKVESESDRT